MSKTVLFPFEIQHDAKLGRYLVASKEIPQGQIIFQETPLIVGPCGIGIEKSKAFSTCLGCYKNVTSTYNCSNCGWPVCGPACEKIPDHAQFECTVFAECPVSSVTNPPEYEKIKILRCLMLKEKNPEKWGLLMDLQSHATIRKQDWYAVSCDYSYYKFIRQECHLKQFEFDDINHISGVSAINSYKTNGFLGHSHSDGSLRYASFLFYYASLLSHQCVPNSRGVIQQKGKSYVINVIATTTIRRGEPITSSYVESILGSLERRAYLQDNFYFSCKCKQCRDPTELGSFLSSVKCLNVSCYNGWLLPRNPTDPTSEWICNQDDCHAVHPSVIKDTIQEVKAKMRLAQNANDFLEILEIYKGNVLHKNHYIILSIECELLRIIGGLLGKTDESEMLRLVKCQMDFARHCLSITDLIQPGATKSRGKFLYSLQDALLTLCTQKIKQCQSKNDLEMVRKKVKKQFAEALEIMKETKEILIMEPVGSSEWNSATILSLETPRVKFLIDMLKL